MSEETKKLLGIFALGVAAGILISMAFEFGRRSVYTVITVPAQGYFPDPLPPPGAPPILN